MSKLTEVLQFQTLESVVYRSHCECTVVECRHVIILRNTKEYFDMHASQPFEVQI